MRPLSVVSLIDPNPCLACAWPVAGAPSMLPSARSCSGGRRRDRRVAGAATGQSARGYVAWLPQGRRWHDKCRIGPAWAAARVGARGRGHGRQVPGGTGRGGGLAGRHAGELLLHGRSGPAGTASAAAGELRHGGGFRGGSEKDERGRDGVARGRRAAARRGRPGRRREGRAQPGQRRTRPASGGAARASGAAARRTSAASAAAGARGGFYVDTD